MTEKMQLLHEWEIAAACINAAADFGADHKLVSGPVQSNLPRVDIFFEIIHWNKPGPYVSAVLKIDNLHIIPTGLLKATICTMGSDHSRHNMKELCLNREMPSQTEFSFGEFFLKDDLTDLLVNDTLLVFCVLDFIEDTISSITGEQEEPTTTCFSKTVTRLSMYEVQNISVLRPRSFSSFVSDDNAIKLAWYLTDESKLLLNLAKNDLNLTRVSGRARVRLTDQSGLVDNVYWPTINKALSESQTKIDIGSLPNGCVTEDLEIHCELKLYSSVVTESLGDIPIIQYFPYLYQDGKQSLAKPIPIAKHYKANAELPIAPGIRDLLKSSHFLVNYRPQPEHNCNSDQRNGSIFENPISDENELQFAIDM